MAEVAQADMNQSGDIAPVSVKWHDPGPRRALGGWHDARLCCCVQLAAPIGLSGTYPCPFLEPFPSGGRGAPWPLTISGRPVVRGGETGGGDEGTGSFWIA